MTHSGVATIPSDVVGPGPRVPADIVARTRSLGPLENSALWQGLLVLAAAAALGAYAWRHRRGWRRGLLATLMLALLGTGLAGLNDYVGYVRNAHDLARLIERGPEWVRPLGKAIDPGGADEDQAEAVDSARAVRRLSHARQAGTDEVTVRRLALPDASLGVPSGATEVMLPPGYDTPANRGRRYPVVYLIHGYPYGSSSDWFTAGDAVGTMQALLAEHVVSPMIVVSVDMTAASPSTDWECLNVPSGPQLESYLTRWVVPRIDHLLRTVANRSGRALGGMSGGGFCALNIGLHHLPTFSSLLITEPYDDPGDAARLLGGNPALVRHNTPRAYLPSMLFTAPIATLLDAPAGAPTDVRTAWRIARALAARRQPVALREEYGFNHTWHTARAALPFLLTYADQHFSRAVPHRPGAEHGHHRARRT